MFSFLADAGININLPKELSAEVLKAVWWDGAYRGAVAASLALIIVYCLFHREPK